MMPKIVLLFEPDLNQVMSTLCVKKIFACRASGKGSGLVKLGLLEGAITNVANLLGGIVWSCIFY